MRYKRRAEDQHLFYGDGITEGEHTSPSTPYGAHIAPSERTLSSGAYICLLGEHTSSDYRSIPTRWSRNSCVMGK